MHESSKIFAEHALLVARTSLNQDLTAAIFVQQAQLRGSRVYQYTDT